MKIIAGLNQVRVGQIISVIDDSGESPLSIPGAKVIQWAKRPMNTVKYQVKRPITMEGLATALLYRSVKELDESIKAGFVTIQDS